MGLQKKNWGFSGEEAWEGANNFVEHSFVHTQSHTCVRVHLSARKGTFCACEMCFIGGGIIQKSLTGSLSNFIEKFPPWTWV